MIKNLSGIVDIFLTDFKYMDVELAARYSNAPDYPEVAARALEEMVSIAGTPVFDEAGMMCRGVIVRHLLLPGHKKNAKSVIKHVYDTYGDQVYLSLMSQYTPFERLREKTEYHELCRKVTKREYQAVVDYAIELGVRNAFIQEGDVAGESLYRNLMARVLKKKNSVEKGKKYRDDFRNKEVFHGKRKTKGIDQPDDLGGKSFFLFGSRFLAHEST